MNKEIIPKGRQSNIKRAYKQGLKDKEIIKKVLSNPYLGKGGGYHLKDIKKALKLKEEEVLKKIKMLKEGFIEDWEFCKKANTEPHIHPRRVIEFIDKIFEEELKGNKK